MSQVENLNSNLAHKKNGNLMQTDIQKLSPTKQNSQELIRHTRSTSESSSKSSNKSKNKENNDMDSDPAKHDVTFENRTKSDNECASGQSKAKNNKVHKKRNSKKVSKSLNK